MAIFHQFGMVFGKGICTLVAGLLIEQLSLKEVGHGRDASLVVVAVQAQIFLSLLYALLCEFQLLICLLYPIPRVLHTYLQ